MIDWNRWLPGLSQDDPEDPISKTLRTLQQGASDVGAGIGQGAQDLGTGISSGLSAAGSVLGSAAESARSYIPDFTPAQPRTPESFAPEDPSSQAMFPPGTPEPPGAQQGASLGSVASDIGSAVNTGLGAFTGAVLPSREHRMAAQEALRSSARELPLPRPAEALAPIDVALGNQPGTALQAAQDVSGVLGPETGLPAAAARTVERPVQRAVSALGEAASGATEGVRRAAAANAERMAAADARMAAEGGTQLPGTLGVITDNPLEASRATRAGIVPPDVADQLGYPVRIPEDPAHIRAIEAAGGSVDPDRGVTLNVIRMSDPEAAGGVATRGAPFYTAGPPGARSPYAKTSTAGPAGVGGQQRIEGQTRFRSPLLISAAPGEPEGFNDAVRQLDIRSVPLGTDAEIAQAQARADAARAAWQQARTENVGAPFGTLSPERHAEIELATANDALARLRGGEPVKEYQVKAGIAAAKRAGPAGSPERAQALKDLVSRYGGDPNLIDDLIALRGADMGESVYAVKENIVSGNARAKGYDGVITVQPRSPAPHEIAAHPAVKAAETERFEINRRIGQIVDEIDARAAESPGLSGDELHRDPKVAPLIDEYNRLYQRLDQMPQALEDAKTQAYRELSSGRITELMDPREARNPTPGGPDQARIDAARQRAGDAFTAQRAAESAWYDRGYDPSLSEAERQSLRDAVEQSRAALHDANAEVGAAMQAEPRPPGYALRSDIPRAPGTRASTIVENPRYADVDQAYTAAAERSKAAQAAATAAEDAHQATPNAANWRAYRAAQDELVSARSAWNDARTALDAELERGRYVTAPPEPPGSTTASGTAGTLPAAGTSPDRLAAVNRALGQGVASAVSGGVGAQVNEQMNPDDPYAQAKGFAVGALGPLALQRGARGLARLAGRETALEGGARIALGDVPPSQIRRPGLPGFEPPPPTPLREAADALAVPTAALEARFPGVAAARTAAEQRAEHLRLRGIAPPSAWDWLKQAGYSGIYGPATATSQLAGGALDLALAQPKELTRAIVAGRPGSYVRQLRAQAAAIPEGVSGLVNTFLGRGGAAGARAASGGSQGTASLSERVVNPVAHLAARAMERPGEALAEAPDALFRPVFTAQGMQREADRIAAEMGHRGAEGAATADRLMADAKAFRDNPDQPVVSGTARRIVDAGKAYADEMGYKGDPGGVGVWIGKQARRDDGTGFLASFLVPFTRTSANIGQAAARSTPGVGLLPGVRRGRPIRSFDVMYDQAFGTLAASGLAAYAAAGGLTGSGPADKAERDALTAKGWQPRSFRVGDYYVPNRALGKFQPILDTIGEAHDWWAYGKPGAGGMAYSADAVKRLGNIATDQIGLSGLADIYSIVDGGLGLQGPGLVARSVTRYVPYGGIIRAAAIAADPNARKPEPWRDTPMPPGATLGERVVGGLEDAGRAVGQQVAQNVPFLRGGVPVAQDVLGRPMPNPQEGLGVLVPKTTVARDDPTVSAFQQAGVDISAPKTQLTVDTIPVDLTPEETRRWNTARGEVLIRVAPGMTRRDFWSKPEARQQAMQDVLRDANAAADAKILASIGASEVQRRVREAGKRQRETLTQKAS